MLPGDGAVRLGGVPAQIPLPADVSRPPYEDRAFFILVSAQLAVGVLQAQAPLLLRTMTQRPASSTASTIVFDCQRAIPNSRMPKSSASEREIVIAVSTTVAPSSQPRLELLPRMPCSI